ncbi:hypothetical protein L6452_40500 [Arctium lappa]|uniref:Uncharacterized protein n=1 Tax=Arctium lappa TaxID=4217 RepID=A0ACB8XMV2_ARCLA|nr:hypothetical protein L6452_40500 [Arctium lappa]
MIEFNLCYISCVSWLLIHSILEGRLSQRVIALQNLDAPLSTSFRPTLWLHSTPIGVLWSLRSCIGTMKACTPISETTSMSCIRDLSLAKSKSRIALNGSMIWGQ